MLRWAIDCVSVRLSPYCWYLRIEVPMKRTKELVHEACTISPGL